ncbi:endonuclease NucS domain-containing protein [Streptomyces sp. IBSBF 2435]|uniref:endonuclease NucS domain-containing protein n=1 Tax=Streptomyces sp. IBSBF 2435 TaxID=2903531 RepID=UPI002FDB9DCC
MDHLFTVSGQKATPVTRTGLAAEGLEERRDLQEWVIAHPQVLGESVLVVTAEFDRWADSDGVPAKDRLDVLGLDATGRLVVVELKRRRADRDVHLQVITYAALVSRFDLDSLAQAHHRFRKNRGETVTEGDCRQRLLDHVDGEWDPELLRRPRLVIIAADFPKQVTHTAVWLSEMNLDIDLIQVGLWKAEGHLVAGFAKVYPTPEVEEFTLAPARIGSEAAALKIKERSRAQDAVRELVSAGILPDGTRLRLRPQHRVTEEIRQAITAWAAEEVGRTTVRWANTTTDQLTWDADGQSYSAGHLTEHIFTTVTGRSPSSIQGTTWWVVDADHVPEGVDPDEWAALADTDLAQLAKQVRGDVSVGRDWTDFHTVLAAIPSGRWTTYGDLATAIGSHALPIGTHIANCEDCPNAWRVLTVKRRVSPKFRWLDSERTDTAADLLRKEGIVFHGDMADPGSRMTPEELSRSLSG